MKEQEERAFAEVLNEIFTSEPLPIADLYRLSDMNDDDAALFWQGWTAVPDERRQIIVRHLADISEDNFIVDFSPIFVASLDDTMPDVRVAALDGLWDSLNLRLIPTIIDLLKTDPNEQVQTAAAATLGHYVLLAEWGQLPERILPNLVETMITMYEQPETAVSVRRVLLEGLGAADDPRISKLIAAAYESNDPAMQMSAVFAMGNSADRRWSATVLAEMESPYEDMRVEAAQAAGNIGNSDFVPQLAALAYDEDLAVQIAAVTALGKIGGDDAQRILVDILDDPDMEDNDVLLEEAELAMQEAAMLAGDFDFGDFLPDDLLDEPDGDEDW